jgi:4-hydroxy-3-methylbut-2-enyl diphosphate reductase IspH
VTAGDWLQDATRIGITAGASTPNNKVGETIARVVAAAGLDGELVKVLSEG